MASPSLGAAAAAIMAITSNRTKAVNLAAVFAAAASCAALWARCWRLVVLIALDGVNFFIVFNPFVYVFGAGLRQLVDDRSVFCRL